jgi:uncharacterized protein YlxW (UPF0749 family)
MLPSSLLGIFNPRMESGGTMKKQFAAVAAAILMTACMGAALFAIGGSALLNSNGVAAANSPAQSGASMAKVAAPEASQQGQVQQLQSLVAQYQARDQQYQAREQQYKQQLDQSNAQVRQAQVQMQEIQALLSALQQRGLITVTGDGQIFINQ